MTHHLERYSWDQATILHLATAVGFRAWDIPAGTIRRWAHEGRIQAIGKAPGGAHLYQLEQVAAVADQLAHQPTRRGA